jgi:predicted O-methyltransferase YrrM
MEFISKALDEYVVSHSEDEPELLQQLYRETHQKVLQPRMLSGHYQGRVLSMLSKIIKPRSILEIGTYTGYSAICLAEGMHPEGILHTIDHNEELHDLQRRYFERSGYGKQIKQYTGDALRIISELDMTFDLIFIDADKENYVNYFHAIIDKLETGGIILSDNVLWSGKVLANLEEDDLATKGIVAYNKLLKDDPRIETNILPIRDGLTISRKR